MKRSELNQWIQALLSGKYRKGLSSLCEKDDFDGESRYCCLGVWAEMKGFPKHEIISRVTKEPIGVYSYMFGASEDASTIPYSVRPFSLESQAEIITLNDEGFYHDEVKDIGTRVGDPNQDDFDYVAKFIPLILMKHGDLEEDE